MIGMGRQYERTADQEPRCTNNVPRKKKRRARLGVDVAELSAQRPNVAEVAGLQRARTCLLHVIALAWQCTV